MLHLTDQDILLRLKSFEDGLVERKVQSDIGDCLKTAVAFANTAPIGVPGILFVGVRDNGEIQGIQNPDKLQQTVSAKIAVAYPQISTLPRVLSKDGKQFIAILIPGSENRPHFAGQAYVRDGSKSVPASMVQFDKLIAERNSKSYEILKWKDKTVTFTQPAREYLISGTTQWVLPKQMHAVVIDCNQYYVTLANSGPEGDRNSYPLRVIELNFDDRGHRLELRLLEGSLPNS